MKVTYIHHSSFLVETDENYFLFDYFEGELPEFKEDKPLMISGSGECRKNFLEKPILPVREKNWN